MLWVSGEGGSPAALGPDPAVGLCRGDSCVQAGGEKCIKSGSELGNTCVGTLVIKGKFNPVPNAPHGGLCQVNEGDTQLNEAWAWQSGRHWGVAQPICSQVLPSHAQATPTQHLRVSAWSFLPGSRFCWEVG